MKKNVLILLLACCFACPAVAQTPVAIEDELYGYVLGIEGSITQRRGEFIKDQLKQMGVGYVAAPFSVLTIRDTDTVAQSGENIIVRIGHGEKKIVIGAHYDVVDGSPGANDNGSGVAVLLGLVNHLRSREWKHSIEICFFDKEESGCTGSAQYVQKYVMPAKHLAMINLDIEGTGDELYIGPADLQTTPMLLPIVHEAEQQTGFPAFENAVYPESDYLSFARFHLENISISVVPRGDGNRLSRMIAGGVRPDSASVPRVLRAMHTPNDRSMFIEPKALKMSYEFTETLLLLLNSRR
jgi:Zn-dependent M28 family amino/carboxypeptidase